MTPENTTYPTPLVISPLSPTKHTHTFILLHGRGSNAPLFGDEFLYSSKIASQLPTVRFVFPTASRRRATICKGVYMNQWFDIYSLEDPGERADLQIDGLCETGAFLRNLIHEEAKMFGDQDPEDRYRRIILGGLSQGCAMGIFLFLAGGLDGDMGKRRLGGFVGMSGWLPFNKDLDEIFQASSSVDGDDPFAHGSAKGVDEPPELQAVNHVRDILDLSPLPATISSGQQNLASHLQSPIFLGHGSADDRVSIRLGEQMAHFLSESLKLDVTWKVYEEFEHWYKVPDEIDDIVRFLREKVGVPSA
ncbi:Phospholipase/Carboxylesterase [Aspergillus sclerotialis]|uniref:Phospholipase/Carboxylesterase n=1 Tax=Aspergillus sclerotialis TaxID=2070753 RepID=A0A3A2Z534_9EURO|nr:Phospholipase/Carboxylesterase [Aspergillus sclerotialis]